MPGCFTAATTPAGSISLDLKMRAAHASTPNSVTPWAGTGNGVKVAVIDSGINPQHSHVQRVAGGTHIVWGEDGKLSFREEWRDSLGHGTAIAGVLRSKAHDVELHSVKVFDKVLSTHAEVVAEAIRWAADHHMDIANCSLSTNNAQHRTLLQEACDYAAVRSMLIVASSDEGTQPLYPSSLSGVIAVAGDISCAWDDYYYECSAGVFRAHPHPRPLPRLPRRLNLQGHSFAAAHIAACLARLREQCPGANREDMVRVLIAHAPQRKN